MRHPYGLVDFLPVGLPDLFLCWFLLMDELVDAFINRIFSTHPILLPPFLPVDTFFPESWIVLIMHIVWIVLVMMIVMMMQMCMRIKCSSCIDQWHSQIRIANRQTCIRRRIVIANALLCNRDTARLRLFGLLIGDRFRCYESCCIQPQAKAKNLNNE